MRTAPRCSCAHVVTSQSLRCRPRRVSRQHNGFAAYLNRLLQQNRHFSGLPKRPVDVRSLSAETDFAAARQNLKGAASVEVLRMGEGRLARSAAANDQRYARRLFSEESVWLVQFGYTLIGSATCQFNKSVRMTDTVPS